MMHFELIFVYGVRLRVQLFFTCGYSVVPAQFVEKILLSLLNGLGTFVKNQFTINVSVHFWTLNSIQLTYMSILMPVPHCLHYCKCAVSFEIGK